MKRAPAVVFLVSVLAAQVSPAGEIGFVEDFALARDREEALKLLIPGTPDHYYYKCLHLLNSGRLGEVRDVIKLWRNRHGQRNHLTEIENRLYLLEYDTNRARSLEFIRRRLGLQFNHQRIVPGRKTDHPTRLDQGRISRETLTRLALARHSNSLRGFEDTALDFLVDTDLNIYRLRELLRRLSRPDHAPLVDLVVKEIGDRRSSGFGRLKVHGLMLLDQLEELARRMPDVLKDPDFVNTYMVRLHPNPDVDWRHDDAATRAYFDRLLAFVRRLAHAQNSLKAHVIYHRLAWDRTKGVHDRGLFMEYIRLPRNARYVEPVYLGRREHRGFAANLGQDFRRTTLFPPVRDDEPLVREYLAHFLEDAPSYREFGEYIREDYLKRVFAETKILAGKGDMERWYSVLDDPARYQQLKERVDIDFAPTNKVVFGPDDEVVLDLYVKNVKQLMVKVFEINTTNYYREKRSAIDAQVDLDGLVANDERTHTYDVPPLRRVLRRFEFPKLDRRGVFAVEFIGNGESSRALVKKGELRFLERSGLAGHVFTVLDERNRVLKGATLWMDGHEYAAAKDGKITVPYTEKPCRQKIVLTHEGFSTLGSFDHKSEGYSLVAGFYVDRESLVRSAKAKVLVRPALYMNGVPVSLSVLEDVVLTIRSTDREGVQSTQDVRGLKLSEATELVHEFRVPDDLTQIAFTLAAKVEHMGKADKIDLAASGSFGLNRIDATEKVEDLHLARTAGGYVLHVLGKTGEPRADRPVNLRLKHRDFSNEVHVTLQTDARGRVELGRLADIARVMATGPEGTSRQWRPGRDVRAHMGSVHERSGAMVRVPCMDPRNAPSRETLSLIEKRGGAFFKDRFDALAIRNGFVEITGLGRGDYDLLLKDSGRRIDIRLSDGVATQGHVLSGRRFLEQRNAKPLQIASVEAGAEAVKVTLANATKFARVHVYATRFVPGYDSFARVGAPTVPDPQFIVMAKGESGYVSGRVLSDEHRYILDRKYAEKFPGNMLKRPSLLLNPWAIRDTQTGALVGGAGHGGRGSRAYGGRAGGRAKRAAARAGGTNAGREANLDFLADAAAVKLNLEPDADGVVTVPREEIGDRQLVYIVAVDPENTVYREVALAETSPGPKDLRLRLGLDPAAHATEKKKITILRAGEELVIEDITTSDLGLYDSLPKVYTLYSTLRPDAWLTEFAFILNWHKMSPELKREKYSKYACHELSTFVYRRDPEFFMDVVVPYLKNKKDKTFVDEMLLARDLSGHMRPWAHGRLNVVERALLAPFIRGERDATARHVRELYELLPPDIERFNHLFKTAIRGKSLDASPDDGFADAKQVAIRLERADRRARGAAAAIADMSIAGRAEASARAPTEPAATRPAPGPRRLAAKKEKADRDALAANGKLAAAEEEVFFEGEDKARRKQVRQLFRKLEKTKEWVENNYYHIPIERQNAGLIKVNAFWNDLAASRGKPGFMSTNFAWASTSFAEMMLAMSLVEIPAEAGEHDLTYDDARLAIRAASPMVVFHKEIEEAELSETTPILISQNFFRLGDRFRFENNERLDKYVTEEFVIHTVYGCQVVLTNPTSSPQKLDLLLQVPRGAMPVKNGFYTRGVHARLNAYSTATFEYHFYFPQAGRFAHYPVHVAKNELVIAWAKPFEFNVVSEPTRIDTTAWDHISQNGTEDEVLEYLDRHNPRRVKLPMIAWRMRDAEFFGRVTRKLEGVHVYDHTLWSYGIFHDRPAAVREYLQHADGFVRQCGAYIDTTLLTIDPVIRRSYQHMEYEPLVNARAHKFGKRRAIVNDRFLAQYNRLMKVLTYRPELDHHDLMLVTYYMLLQDRVAEARGFFGRVEPARVEPRMQHDYMAAYLDFFADTPARARGIAERYRNHPVPKWQKRFLDILAQLDEIEGEKPSVIDEKDRTQRQTELAATEPGLELSVEAKRVKLDYQNIAECRVNYYLMDIELLFSRNPFVQAYSGQFSYVRPNESRVDRLPKDKGRHEFDLPARFDNENVLIEVEAEGVRRSQAYFSNSLTVQIVENYGQLRATHSETRAPLAKVYVKVFARMRGGKVAFFKDGYTDLRGRFDYTSLSTNELDNVERFSILVLSEEHGGVVREAAPPKR
ncbi:MAG: hypothetical protein ACYTKD_06910 [Planctomycetota bacterium]